MAAKASKQYTPPRLSNDRVTVLDIAMRSGCIDSSLELEDDAIQGSRLPSQAENVARIYFCPTAEQAIDVFKLLGMGWAEYIEDYDEGIRQSENEDHELWENGDNFTFYDPCDLDDWLVSTSDEGNASLAVSEFPYSEHLGYRFLVHHQLISGYDKDGNPARMLYPKLALTRLISSSCVIRSRRQKWRQRPDGQSTHT
jgi:hypothetical protein